MASEQTELEKLEQAYLKPDTTDKAVKAQDVLNAIRMIILSDDDAYQMVFRYNMPSQRFCAAAAMAYTVYDEHGDTAMKNYMKLYLGYLRSKGGEAIKDLVQAVTAEKRQEKQGMGDKFSSWVDSIGKK